MKRGASGVLWKGEHCTPHILSYSLQLELIPKKYPTFFNFTPPQSAGTVT